MKWTQQEAIALCVKLEAIAPNHGAHIVLSGGCLYKEGPRKDADIIIYRIRQAARIDFDGFFADIAKIGVAKISGFGFCHKAAYKGKFIDFLSPEEAEGTYEIEDERPDADKVLDAVFEELS